MVVTWYQTFAHIYYIYIYIHYNYDTYMLYTLCMYVHCIHISTHICLLSLFLFKLFKIVHFCKLNSNRIYKDTYITVSIIISDKWVFMFKSSFFSNWDLINVSYKTTLYYVNVTEIITISKGFKRKIKVFFDEPIIFREHSLYKWFVYIDRRSAIAQFLDETVYLPN